jgi:hypothetical protein
MTKNKKQNNNNIFDEIPTYKKNPSTKEKLFHHKVTKWLRSYGLFDGFHDGFND